MIALTLTRRCLATPAAYWFLRGFEIDNVASSATYVNVMTYDYHGPWDLKVQGEDGTAKAHTSVEDIMDTIRLYTRAKVPFNKCAPHLPPVTPIES